MITDLNQEPTAKDVRAMQRRLVDRPKGGKALDLREVRQPHRAARLLWAYLRVEHNASECWLSSPEDTARLGYGNSWFVCWEGGPYDWAVYLSGGGNIYGEAHHWGNAEGCPYAEGQAHVLHLENPEWFLEAYHRFSLSVVSNR